MLNLSNLSPSKGSTKQRKRVGRGQGSGHGKTAGRGHKGAKSRSGYGSRPGFEGGQMPLQRRVPKRGFTNTFKKEYVILSLTQLNGLTDGDVTPDSLVECGMIKKGQMVKVLANGEITNAVNITVDKISKQARELIEKAGGSVKLIGE